MADETCAEDGGGAESCIDAMDHIASYAKASRPEYTNVEGEH